MNSMQALIDEYIVYKRRLGGDMKSSESLLRQFARFAARTGCETLCKDAALNFLDSLKETNKSIYIHASVLREFGKYLALFGHEAYILPPKFAASVAPEPPYFFSDAEIQRFFASLDAITSSSSYVGRDLVLKAIFRLIYCCGLRCKEARTLQCENVNLHEGYIDIKDSKGPKSRRVFTGPELTDYMRSYDDSISRLFPSRKFFFPHEGSCYDDGFLPRNFKRIWIEAFPEFKKGFTRPRAYDFRHHFVWTNINNWVKDGMDVNVLLPYLMRYMGHAEISSTLYYFRFVPDFYPTFQGISCKTESLIPEVTYEEAQH